MAIRRRRKTLTNLLSSMETRVTSVELRPINLLSAAQIAAALAGEDENLSGGPDTVVGSDFPNQYTPVIDGYYYSKNITGSGPRVELYFTSDTGVADGDTLAISGIHDLIHSGTRELEISKEYKTLSVDSPPWTDGDRSTYGGKRDTPDATITNTALFNPSIVIDYGVKKQLIVKRKIASVSATTTTATITFTATNYFEVGDAVYVDMPSDTPFYGLDGLYRVKTIGANFITFDFSTALDEPINSAAVTEDRYVHAVARSYTRDGATFIDTSTTPDTVYVWKDIRWVTYSTGSVTKDKVAPSPIENLEATDEDETPSGAAVPRRKVTLTWSAPTTNADDTPLDDLVGYTIWWKELAGQPAWEKADSTGAETNFSKGNFLQGKPAFFRVFARDAGGNLSTPVDITHTTGVSTPTVQTPKAPAVTTYLGTIKISYDDLTEFGLVQAATAKEVEVFFSDVSGFIPGPTNYYGKFPANAGSYIIIPGTELVDNTDYYIKIRVRDIYNNFTEASTQVTIRAKISDIVTYDMIDVGTLTGQVIIGLDMRTSSNPSVSGGIISNQQGLTAYDSGGNQTFRINATNGVVSIGDYLGKDEIAGLYVGKVDADNKYATIVTANGISITANTANTNATNALNTANSAQADATQARTDISAGNIVVSKPNLVNALNGNSLTTTIDGNVITTGTILANKIGTGKLPVDVVNTGILNAGNIEVGTLNGRTVQTASSGQRIVMSGSANTLTVYNSGGTLVGTLFGGSSTSVGVRLENAADEYLSLYPGRINLQGNNVGIQIISSATKVASTITLDSGRVNIPKLGTDIATSNEVGLVTAFNGTGLSDGVISAWNSSGTNNGVIHAGSGGQPFRVSMSGTGTRNVNVTSTGTLTTVSSDERLKQDIELLDVGLDLIDKLSPKKFAFKADPGVLEYGLIAQEVRQALIELGIRDSTNLVYEDDSEDKISQLPEGEVGPVLGVEYMKLIPILLNSVKELKARVEFLEEERAN